MAQQTDAMDETETIHATFMMTSKADPGELIHKMKNNSSFAIIS